MARIPLGGFGVLGGNAQAPVAHSRADTRGIGAEFGALADLAGTAGDVAQGVQQIQAEERRRQQEADDAFARARVANSLADHELRSRGLVDSLTSRVETGDLDYRELETRFDEEVADLGDPDVAGLDLPDAERVTGAYRRNVEAARLSLRVVGEKARRQEGKSNVVGVLDSMDKLAGDPSADVDKLAERARALRDVWVKAGLDPSQFDSTVQSRVDKWWAGHAIRRANLGRDDAGALAALAKDLTEDGGYYSTRLDVDKRNAILGQVLGAQARLENKAAHAADKREADAGRAINEMDQQIASGIQATPEMWVGWLDRAKGTSREAEAQERVKEEVEVQRVLSLPPSQQDAYVQERRAALLAAGGTVRQGAHLDRIEATVKKTKELMRTAPLLYLQQRTGDKIEMLDMGALAQGDVAALAPQIAERMKSLATLRRQTNGEAGNAPLLPQEAQALTTALGGLTPRQQVQVFGGLRRAFADDAAYMGAMQQIAPDSPVRAFAGVIYAKQRDTTVDPGGWFRDPTRINAGDVARTLLEGEAILNKTKGDQAADGKGGGFKMPPDADLRGTVTELTGAAFAGRSSVFEQAYQAVRAYYAGASSEAGDFGGEVDDQRARQAVRAVLGESVDVNGKGDVFPPWGMGGDAFEDAVENAWGKVLGQLPAGASTRFEVYGLRQYGDGVYMVTHGKDFLHGRDGKPLRLVVKP